MACTVYLTKISCNIWQGPNTFVDKHISAFLRICMCQIAVSNINIPFLYLARNEHIHIIRNEMMRFCNKILLLMRFENNERMLSFFWKNTLQNLWTYEWCVPSQKKCFNGVTFIFLASTLPIVLFNPQSPRTNSLFLIGWYSGTIKYKNKRFSLWSMGRVVLHVRVVVKPEVHAWTRFRTGNECSLVQCFGDSSMNLAF